MAINALVSHGNLKIGKDTLIFSITSAEECISKAIGLCKVPEGKCYAMKSERMYKNTRNFRARQTMFWDVLSPKYMADYIDSIAKRKKANIKYIRFGESGDFRNQSDVEKLKYIAHYLPYTVYTYTARQDLDYSNLPDNLIINGTGFMIDNKINVITDKKWTKHTCPADCRYCTMCKSKNGLEIGLMLH